MQLNSKINDVLLSELRSLVAREREVTTEVLHYFREVESRKLHLERGYPSLFEFAMKELGYSAGSAHRRIAAMRLLKALPELEMKIQSGELSLSVAAQAQGFFREESKRRKISIQEKKETVSALFGLSTRDCERKLASISPQAALPKERERVVTEELTQIQFLADRELLGKFEKLKGLLAHQNFEGSYAELFRTLADLALKKLAPFQGGGKNEKIESPTPAQNVAESHKNILRFQPNPGSSHNRRSSLKRNRYIPAGIKRAVYFRDGGKCVYRDRLTYHQCGTRHALDTIISSHFVWEANRVSRICAYSASRIIGSSRRN